MPGGGWCSFPPAAGLFPIGDVELPLFEQGIGDDAVHFGVDLRRDEGLRGGNAADFVEPGARGVGAGFVVEPFTRRFEIGAEGFDGAAGHDLAEVALGEYQHERFGAGQAGQVKAFGFPVPTPAIGLFAIIDCEGEDAGKLVEVALQRSLGDLKAFIGKLPTNRLNADLVRVSRNHSQHSPVAKERVMLLGHYFYWWFGVTGLRVLAWFVCHSDQWNFWQFRISRSAWVFRCSAICE